MKRTEIINQLIKENGYKSYLEIGLGEGDNFRGVECEDKIGVDPVGNDDIQPSYSIYKSKSDDFFKSLKPSFRIDSIFIDGLHHSEQVEKDIINSYKVLNKGGVILVHDCLPPNKECTVIPRNRREWCGDVFRAVEGFKRTYEGKIRFEYFDEPYGLFAIWKTGRFSVKEGFNWGELSYEEFRKIKGL